MSKADEMRNLADEYHCQDNLYRDAISIEEVISDIEEDIYYKAKNGKYDIRKDMIKSIDIATIVRYFENIGYQCRINRGIFKNSVTITWG